MQGGRWIQLDDEGLKIRSDILEKVMSDETEVISPQLTNIYLRLIKAPPQLWEGENVLRLTGEEGRTAGVAWAQIEALAKSPRDDVRRALEWLHDERIIIFSTSRNEREIAITFEGISRPGRGR